MSDKCLIFGFACGVHRVPVRRARPRSIDVEFDQPKPAHLRPSSTLHLGGANKHRRGPQRPAGARGANETLKHRNGAFPWRLTVNEVRSGYNWPRSPRERNDQHFADIFISFPRHINESRDHPATTSEKNPLFVCAILHILDARGHNSTKATY